MTPTSESPSDTGTRARLIRDRLVRRLVMAAGLAVLVHGAWLWTLAAQRAQATADALAASFVLHLGELPAAGAAWPSAPAGPGEQRLWRDAAGAERARSGPSGGWWIQRAAPVGEAGSGRGEVVVGLSPLRALAWLVVDPVLAAALIVPVAALRRRKAVSAVAPAAAREAHPDLEDRALRAHFESSPDALFICDAAGRVLGCNRKAQDLVSGGRESVVGRAIRDWILPSSGEPSPKGKPESGPVPSGETVFRPSPERPAFEARTLVSRFGSGKSAGFVVAVHDLTEERKTQRTLQTLANYDSLTGLPNRVLFRDRLAHAMERANRTGRAMALFFLDLDRFKVVNDSLGHEAGDQLLRHVASVLTGCLREGDSVGRAIADGDPITLSRLGGDEFTVILEDIGGAEDAALVARRVLEALAAPLRMRDEEVQVSASIGISLYPNDGVDLDGIIRNTDMAMYRSKSLGRNTFTFFSEDLNAAVRARLSLESSLRRALERREFRLFYQPKASLRTGEITGVEALLRWHCPGRGMVAPDQFITLLEETGMIVQAGAWVIREACTQLAEWDRLGLPRMSVAVNLSARQLRHSFLVAHVQDTLRESGLSPDRLELELTESLLMEDTEGNRAVLAAFRRMGVRLAIDDFGTGHSSLSYLRRLDADTLKIDRSFVTQIPHDAEDCAIATAVVALANSLQMKVVAEGVENESQAQFLRDLGCQEMQGWLLSRALPAEQLEPWLRDRQRAAQAQRQPKRFADPMQTELPAIVIPDAPRQVRSTERGVSADVRVDKAVQATS